MMIVGEASPRQVAWNRPATVLLGNDVVNLEPDRGISFRQAAILAPAPSPLANEPG